jgi:hypothetical protein
MQSGWERMEDGEEEEQAGTGTCGRENRHKKYQDRISRAACKRKKALVRGVEVR